MISRRALVGAGAAAGGAGLLLAGTGRAQAGAQAPAAPPRLDEIFGRGRIGDGALSPQGGRVALLGETEAGSGRGPQAAIQFFDTQAMAQPPLRTVLADLEADKIDWASEDRLLVWVTSANRTRRVVAMAPDGSDQVVLFEHKTGAHKPPLNLSEIVALLPQEPDHVIMAAWDPAHEVAALYRVNVRRGGAVLIERGGARTVSWRCQDGDPVLRYDLDKEGRVMSLLARTRGEGRWRMVRRIHKGDTRDFHVVGATPTPGVLLVAARADGEDAAAVRTLDTRTMRMGEVLSARPHSDVADVLTSASDRFVAAAYYDDRRVYDFADPRMARHFKLMNRAFGDACNIELLDVDESQTRWLGRATGPQEAGAYFLYDCGTRRTHRLGAVRPWLTPARLAPVQPINVRTRDGALIRAYVTTPAAADRAPRPLVVLPHGGPEIRDRQDYDPWAQTLAAQGWIVLQPNFRGSGGYGRAFAQAGWRRWGDRMQADVEDAVDLLIRQRRADPARVVIFGASYGGYAGLMGAVRRPGFYKAVISVAGPSDLPELMRFQKRTAKGDDTDYEFWRTRIGDPSTDGAMLEQASPAAHAAAISARVLLIHGEHDEIVPPSQTRIMAAALKTAGKPCETFIIPGCGHANWGLTAEKDVLQRVIDFIRPAVA